MHTGTQPEYMRAIAKSFGSLYQTTKPKSVSKSAANYCYHSIRNTMSDNSLPSGFKHPRSVVKRVLANPQSEGDGALVRRSIGRYVFQFFALVDYLFFHCQDLGFCRCNLFCVLIWLWVWFFRPDLKSLDPFLMLDEFEGDYWFIQFPQHYSWVYLQSWIHVKLSAKRLIMRLHPVWCDSITTCWISWPSTQRFWDCNIYVGGMLNC